MKCVPTETVHAGMQRELSNCMHYREITSQSSWPLRVKLAELVSNHSADMFSRINVCISKDVSKFLGRGRWLTEMYPKQE